MNSPGNKARLQRGVSRRMFGSMSAAEAAANLPSEPKSTFNGRTQMMSPQALEVGTAEATGIPEGDEDARSIASVAKMAGDTAKRFFNAGYAAIASPKEDFGLDTRELLTPVGTQLERASAAVKLESMSHAGIVVIVAVVYFAAFISLLMAIILISLQSQSSTSLNAALTSFALEGICRTIAVLLTTVMSIFFTFRVIRYTMRTHRPILPEQSLLIFFLILVMVTPGYSVYSPYIFWHQYQVALQLTRSINTNNTTSSEGERFAFFFFSTTESANSARTITMIFTVIILAFGTLYFGLTAYFFGKPLSQGKNKQKQDSPRGSDLEAGNKHPHEDKAIERFLADTAVDEQDNEEDDNPNKDWLSSRQMCLSCLSTYKELAIKSNKRVIVLAVVYLIVVMVLVLYYNFLPSQVPFVGMISVLKVCPISGGNFTGNKTNCDPAVLNGVPFARAMTVTAQFLLEVFIAMYLHLQTKNTKLKLKTMPYETNRSKHLGFRYFNSNKRMTFGVILLVSIIVASVGKDEFDLYNIQFNPITETVVASYSPLNQVGINFYKLGFGPFYLLLTCFLFALAVAYLPPDSAPGVRGFCCGGYEVVTERDEGHPAYILHENDVQILRTCRDQARERMKKERTRRRRLLQFKASAAGSAHSKKLLVIKEDSQQERAAAAASGVGEETEQPQEKDVGQETPDEENQRDIQGSQSEGARGIASSTQEENSPPMKSSSPIGETGAEEENPTGDNPSGEPTSTTIEESNLTKALTDPAMNVPGETTADHQTLINTTAANDTEGQGGGIFEQPKLSYVARVRYRRENDLDSVDEDERMGTNTHTPSRWASRIVQTPKEKLQKVFNQMQIPATDRFTLQYEKLAALLKPKTKGEEESFRRHDFGENEALGLIAEQMNANLFCIETEVLLLNFSFMAYCFGGFNEALPFTNEEKQAMLGKDSRYRLVTHLENALTDIQCCVFVDRESDRIYVSFRGTSTSKNIWQDIDYVQVPHPEALQVEPLLGNDEDDLFAKAASIQEPRVHRGFYYAYLSIREAVVDVVSDLIESCERGCVLFCCGHSLGGALATHLALEMGMRFKVMQSNLKGLQVSTFGSPRVGNYSFVSRHRRIVPTTHRFCIGGDPVPKLPPAQVLGEFTKWGYQHVGVEILLDVEKVNLLLGPLFIERQIQHGWGGYVPKNHITGSYVLALSLWCARVHPQYVPDWWLPVVNHLLKSERIRMRRILAVKPELVASVVDQLNKEGAVGWTDDNRAMRNYGCDTATASAMATTSMAKAEVQQIEQAKQATASAMATTSMAKAEVQQIKQAKQAEDILSNPRNQHHKLADEGLKGFHEVESTLAGCGILFEREERAQVLVEAGFVSTAALRQIHRSDFVRLNALVKVTRQNLSLSTDDKKEEAETEPLFDDTCISLLLKSVSANRCHECDYAPLTCPRCAQVEANQM